MSRLPNDLPLPTPVPLGPAPELHELLTVDDVAALLKVNKRWVYQHLRERRDERTRASPARRSVRLPHIRVGKYVRFEAAAVQAFLESLSRSA